MRTHPYFLAGLDATLDTELGAPLRRPAPRQPPRALSFRAPAGRAPTFRPSSAQPSVPRPPPPVSAFRPSVVPPPPPPVSAFRPPASTSSSSGSTSTSSSTRPGLPQFRPQFRPPGRPTATTQSYAQQQQSYAQQSYDQQQQQQYAQQSQQPQAQSDYAQQAQQQAQGGGYQPSTPMGALDYYNEARKLRGMPALPADAGNTDRDIANYLMQRMVGDEDRRATFEETMYAVLILSAQAASRTGDANAAQAMTQAAEQWKQVVLQQRAQAKKQSAAQTYIAQSPNGPAPVQTQEQGQEQEQEQSQEGENKEGEVSGWGDLGESLSGNTRTILAVAGAFGLAWGGLCLWKNRKKKGA